MAESWESASEKNMSDVKELTPEFYYMPEFLSNHNGRDFGTRTARGGQPARPVEPTPLPRLGLCGTHS